MTAQASTWFDLTALRRLADERGVPLGLRTVVIESGASKRLGDVVEQFVGASAAQVAVLMDDVVYAGPDGPVKETLLSHLEAMDHVVRPVRLPSGAHGVHADIPTIEAVASAAAGAQIVVTIGSGTLADIGKVAAQRLDVPHIVVQTATSVNGFSDDQSVLLISGAKRTTPSKWPDALVVDVDILTHAPADLTRAGLGDLLSMFTAPADWLLASTLGLGVPYDNELVDVVRRHGRRLLEDAGGVGRKDPEAVCRLASLLATSGVTMGLAGATAPSSGAEHVISHLLEMNEAQRGARGALHGNQVAVGAVIASAVWARVLAAAPDELPRLSLPDHAEARDRVHTAFARLGAPTAQECWAAYEKKLDYLHRNPTAIDGLAAAWPGLRTRVDVVLLPPKTLLTALRSAGSPTQLSELPSPVDAETTHWAVSNAHRMRDRFVVFDLAELMGLWTDEFVDEILDDLAAVSGTP